MSLAQREKALRQIKAMLKRAESSEFEGEREVCQNKAMQLMVEFGILEIDLREEDQNASIEHFTILLGFGAGNDSAASLVGGLVRLFGGYAFTSIVQRDQVLFNPFSDAQWIVFAPNKNTTEYKVVAIYMRQAYVELFQLWITHLMGELCVDLAKFGMRNARSFIIGWTIEVLKRMEYFLPKIDGSSHQEYAMALVDPEKYGLKHAHDHYGLHIKHLKAHHSIQYNSNAIAQGLSAGQKVSPYGKGVSGNVRRQLT